MIDPGHPDILARIEELTAIGIALSAERDEERLLEQVLQGASALTGADGGSLYNLHDQQELRFRIVLNRSLGLHSGGTGQDAHRSAAGVPLHRPDGSPDHPWSSPTPSWPTNRSTSPMSATPTTSTSAGPAASTTRPATPPARSSRCRCAITSTASSP